MADQADARKRAFEAWCEHHNYSAEIDDPPSPHVEAFIGGFDSGAAVYHDALGWALHRLRAFGYEEDAKEIEDQHGIVYVAPVPKVLHA